ncbi:uncharacterized protein [Watersipora subatra]|uniref:uncharacterized protein n=1 Tax=Watersipora subatra TaxID=2589382 RepID=UPI00355BFCFF
MLDWLKKLICGLSHDEILPGGIAENNINRFKVATDALLSSESLGSQGEKSGILEVNDDELVHYQKNSEPIRWSYRCLRRYGLGNNTFLFESGRRCSTGPGLFAFKCTQADILHNIFTEKLKRFASNRNASMGTNSLHRRPEFVAVQTPNRYSDDVMISASMTTSTVVEEPYLTPFPMSQTYANGDAITGHKNGQTYINCMAAGQGNPDSDYINTTSADTGTESRQNAAPKVKSSANGKPGAATRELNYADLDLPQSNAIDFPQTARKSKAGLQADKPTLQYINLQHSSDEDDDAFLPETINPLSVDLAGGRADSVSVGYMNVQNGNNGRKGASPLTSSVPNNTQYTTIDFHKTAAIASTANSAHQSESSEGLRKTRHDSSADNLS